MREALSTLLVLSAVGNQGKKGVIMVVHHTDCGLMHTTNGMCSPVLSFLSHSAEGYASERCGR